MPDKTSTLSPLRRFFRLAASERKDILSMYLFAIIAGLISLSLPLGIQAVFNFVSGGAITTSWVMLVILVIGGVGAAGLLQIVQISITERIQQRIFTHSAFEFAVRIPHLKAEALRGSAATDLVNRFFDTVTIQKGLSKMLMDLSASSLQILFGLVLLSVYHPSFILFGIGLVGLMAITIRLTGPRGLASSLEESKYKYKLAHWLEEMARSLDTFKFAGSMKMPLERTDGLLQGYLDARQRHYRVLLTKYIVVLGLKVLIITALLVIGSLLVFANKLNVGQFVAMEIVVILLLSAVEKLILTVETVYDVLTALDKIGSVTDLPLERDGGVHLDLSQQPTGLTYSLRQLSLQFPDQTRPAIDRVDLELAPGHRLNVVSEDTAFVTHFFRLLAGFYTGYTGSITVNKVPLQNVRLDDLRHQIGGFSMVQEIFEGSLLENITLGDRDIPLERVLALIEAVGLEDFLRAHPQGLDQPIRNSDIDLSVPLRRKILLARALATHASLLLLHNPMRNMLPKEQEQVVRYIRRHLPKSTLVVASEQADQSGLCDQVLHVSDARLVPHNPQ